MDKNNIRLLYCILGSIILMLLNTYIFHSAFFGIFDYSIGYNSISLTIDFIRNLLSFLGAILIVIFSVILIVRNASAILKNIMSKLSD